MADADMNPSTNTRATTRAKNANQHPGQTAPVRKRHTKEEMAQDRALEQQKKDEKKRLQTKGIKRIAEIEDQMAVDDANAEDAHPRNQKGSLSYVP
jgi:hypothetical protein